MTKDSRMDIGDLRKIIEGLPDNVQVCYERIEDAYFQHHGWKADAILPSDIAGYDREFLSAFGGWYSKKQGKVFITAHY